MTTAAPEAISRPETSLLYMCRRPNLRLVKTPRETLYGPGGRKVGEERGETLEFREGVLRIPRDGQVRLADGRMADSGPIIEWLDSHQLNGHVEEGFWRVDSVAPPVTREELDAVMQAIADHDVEALQAMLEVERAGWAREAVIDPAQGALDRILALQAEIARQAAAKPKGPAQVKG